VVSKPRPGDSSEAGTGGDFGLPAGSTGVGPAR
jgi:hypothetical protein